MSRIMVMCALMVMSVFVQAQGKIAVVSFEQAVLSTDYAKAQIQKAEEDPEHKAKIEKAKALQEEMVALVEKYKKDAPIMSDSEKQALEQKIRSREADLEHIYNQVQEAKAALYKAIAMELNVQAQQAIQQIVEEEGIGLLLNRVPQMVYHADTSYDITAKLTERLNKILAAQAQ